MQRFKKILYIHEPTITSLSPLHRAVQLAVSNNAQLTLCGVNPEIPRTLLNIQEAFQRLHEDQLKSLSAKVADKGADIKILQLLGISFVEIIKEVKHGGHDLVIKPAEETGVLGNLFGSTDLHLMRKCPCPLWIIKASRRKKFSRILAAVDPDPSEPANAELNNLIMDLATSLTRQDKSELHIIHAWSLPREAMLRSRHIGLKKSEVDQLVRDSRNEHKQWLDELLKDYDLEDINSRVHLLKGDPGDVIPSLSRKKRVELIIMGTVARTGIPGFFIGNTAEKVLDKIKCDVLIVK